MGESWHAGGGKTGFYRRLAWDRPSPTLVTRPTMKATDLCHPEKLRPLSVEEYAAIQTFPNGYIFEGKLDDQYRQIGNAVPCSFGEAIGRHIVAFDEGMLCEEQNARQIEPLRRHGSFFMARVCSVDGKAALARLQMSFVRGRLGHKAAQENRRLCPRKYRRLSRLAHGKCQLNYIEGTYQQ